LARKAEHGEKGVVSLGGFQIPGSVAGSCGEPERAENGEAAHGSKFQGHQDLLFRVSVQDLEEVMPESRD
jgi:hypothetical protein